ncbi:MAG: putative bifunctional diguanylate cyclase/phosphodiesterase [Pseudomonadales bacterium]
MDIDDRKNGPQTSAGSLSEIVASNEASAEFLEHIVASVPDLIFVIDLNALSVVYSNRDIFQHFGWPAQDADACPNVTAARWSEMLHPDDRLVSSPTEIARRLQDSDVVDDVFRCKTSDGEWHHFQTRCTRIEDNEADNLALVVARDISDRTLLDKGQRMAVKVFENSNDGIMILDAYARITQVNPALIEMSGFSSEELLGELAEGLILPHEENSGSGPAANDAPGTGLMKEALGLGFAQGECLGIRKSGDAFHSMTTCTVLREDDDSVQCVIVTLRDITESKSNEERIRHLAYYDALTGLPNRTLFHDRLDHELQRCERNNHCAALLFLDLDQFKAVNDSLGHAAGDKLLKIASERLKDNVRSEDTVARMSGDEFTIILSGQSNKEQMVAAASHVARKILRELCDPFTLEGNEAFVSVSIGVSVYPDDGQTPSMLLRNADTAMYFAKEAGKNNFQFYTSKMNAHSVEQLAFQNALHKAVNDQEFEVFYQPQYCYTQHDLRTVESLLRWRQPNGDLVSPMKFIALAEQTGLIIRMGEWLINRSLWQFAEWREMNMPVDRIAINLSARQFGDEQLVHYVSNLLDKYDVPASTVEFELTESVLMADIGVTRSVLQQLKDLGVTVVIDDFGTGYSSLNYLKELPIDGLKIDGSFVAGLPGGKEDQQIIKVIIALAEGFDLRVVAEGVETAEQSAFLEALGCSAAQGYHFAGPKPAYELEQFFEVTDRSSSEQKSA